MFELLKQYEKIGHRKFNLNELKETVGAIEILGDGSIIDHYPLFGNFKQRVLLKAQKDLLKHTDISFTFDTNKTGRKVTEIKFFISKNKPVRTDDRIRTKPLDLYEDIKPIIKKWSSAPDRELIHKLVSQGKKAEHITKAVEYTQDKINSKQGVKNPVGYFVKMVAEVSKQGDLFDSEASIKRELDEKEAAVKNKKKALKTQIDKAQDACNTEAVRVKEKLLKTRYNEVVDIMNDVLEGQPKLKERYETTEERLKSKIVGGYMFSKLKETFPEEYEQYTELQNHTAALKKELANL